MTDAPIGIFDSGFGGLTVARAVMDQLPHEAVVYLGDTARQPYGPKPIPEVREYALECLDHLVEQGVKALVIACNSASAAMLRDARERYDVPVIEVILPATRRAVAATHNGHIGVICTRATADSLAYEDAFAAAPHVTLSTKACPRFVEFVEEGRHRRAGAAGGGARLPRPAGRGRGRHPDPRLHPLPLADGRDLDGDGGRVTLVSSAEECAKDVYRMLVQHGLERAPGGAAGASLPDHRPARGVRDDGSALPRTRARERDTVRGRRVGVGADEQHCTHEPRDPMRMTVIGCSGSYPGPESSASCYLLEAEHGGRTWSVLLDIGNGSLGSLQRYADATAIDAVFLSHLHADHCLDLCGYYVMRKYHPDGALPRIPVWGPEDTARRMAKAYDLDEDPGMNEEFDFIPYGADAVHYGPFTVTVRLVVHPVTAYALRVEAEGRMLAYSGDSGACHGLEDTAREADLFLCEASFLEGEPQPSGPAPDRRRGRAHGHRRRRRSGCCSPTSRRGTTRRRCSPRRWGSTTARWTSRRPGKTYDV